MKFIQRIKNLIELSKIELPEQKKEQITNIINEPPVKMARIIKMKDEKKIINELLEDK